MTMRYGSNELSGPARHCAAYNRAAARYAVQRTTRATYGHCSPCGSWVAAAESHSRSIACDFTRYPAMRRVAQYAAEEGNEASEHVPNRTSYLATIDKMLGIQRVTLLSVGLLGFICFQQSDAYCPNGCNAQGTCGKNDKCTCYLRQDELTDLTFPAYKGADCSLRTCPYGNAWVAVPTAKNEAHPMVECSNKGHCDYSTGHCECFAGYDGKACERAVCPNNCNGRGICLTLQAIISNAPTVPGGASAKYEAWDANKHMGCYCDQGFRGPDCSLKECPSGLDVLLAHGRLEGRDCGGRGKCNYDTGDCECFPGYYGTSCESQTTVH